MGTGDGRWSEVKWGRFRVPFQVHIAWMDGDGL
jgi:hypothetical protein